VRFADPDSGTIAVGGVNLRDYSLGALRKLICYVPQHPVFFSGSLRENLLYGDKRASEPALWKALDAVQLSGVVGGLPEGIETLVNAGPYTFSGGELQRLALARALLRNTPVLVLDESTSALDIPTERAVLQGVAQYRSQTTVIIISHRLGSLTWTDRVIVISNGKVSGDGSHNGLYSKLEVYRELYSRYPDSIAGGEPACGKAVG